MKQNGSSFAAMNTPISINPLFSRSINQLVNLLSRLLKKISRFVNENISEKQIATWVLAYFSIKRRFLDHIQKQYWIESKVRCDFKRKQSSWVTLILDDGLHTKGDSVINSCKWQLNLRSYTYKFQSNLQYFFIGGKKNGHHARTEVCHNKSHNRTREMIRHFFA